MNNKEFMFLKLCSNTKVPIKNANFSDERNLKKITEINKRYYNIGLACGANNILVLDIDEKNEGLDEWNNYISEYDEPLTVKQKTPNNGYHYIFNEINDEYTEEENSLIKMLNNKSGYRTKGLDIRKGNGYIVCEPSSINNKEYKFIRHYNDTKILNMPLTLIKWLLENEKPELINKTYNNNILIIMKDEEELLFILNHLIKYIDNSKY